MANNPLDDLLAQENPRTARVDIHRTAAPRDLNGHQVAFKSKAQSGRHADAWHNANIVPFEVESYADLPLPVQFVGVVSCEPGPDYQIAVDDAEFGTIATEVEQ